jgi:hypothetical protein
MTSPSTVPYSIPLEGGLLLRVPRGCEDSNPRLEVPFMKAILALGVMLGTAITTHAQNFS